MSESGGRDARRRATTRRGFLKAGAAAGAGLAVATGSFGATIEKALAVTPPQQGSLKDIEHVVILMQENRTFDCYFGTLRGVRGFSDPDVLIQDNGRPLWYQWSYATPDRSGYVLPNHFDIKHTSAQSVSQGLNYWVACHTAWNAGKMDQFVGVGELAIGGQPLSHQSYMMGYFTRQDIPFHYALADAFTVCDGFHTSVMAESDGNWCMLYSGTVDPEGTRGGPLIDDSIYPNGSLHWTSYPEELEAVGISWYVYQEVDNFGNNLLPWFEGINNAPQTSSLYQRANTFIPTPSGQIYGPALWAKLRADVEANQLPQVSYILANSAMTEHPTSGPGNGAYFIQQVLEALTANPDVWAKTVFFLTYDDNGGAFDHILPPTAPAGTPGDYINAPFRTPGQQDYDQPAGPVGLGFRVPSLVISPFSAGGYVCHETFDHTSIIQFIEKWTTALGRPAICHNLSDWRRKTVGDLTNALSLNSRPKGTLDFSSLGDGAQLNAEANAQLSLPAPPFPSPQVMPEQEPGTRPVIGPNSGH